MFKSLIRPFILLSLVLALVVPVGAQDDGNEFVILVGETFPTLDVTRLGGSNGFRNLMNGIHEPLIRLEPDGTLTPALATDWSISDDRMTVTLNLREGVTFHDGTPFNAEAVVWNIQAGKSEEIGESAIAAYESIESAEVIDEYTVQINMAQPDANILIALAAGTTTQAFMLSPTAYESMGADEYSLNPVGTGPFQFVSWEPGVQIVVEPYEDYWGDIVSNADRIVFRVVVDNTAATLNYQSGDVHVIFPAQATDIPLMQDVEGTQVQTITQGLVTMALNTSMPPFDNVHNRRAVRYALDVQPVIDLVYAGLAQPAQGFIPPNSWAYSPDSPPVITRDLDAARAELEAAGNPEGFEFDISVVAQPYRIQTLEIFQANLAEVGITMNIQANERARHLETLRENPDLANAGFMQALRFLAAPEAYLRTAAGCNAEIPFVGYCTEEYDDLFNSLSGIFDQQERAEVIQQLDQIAIRDVASIPYVYPETALVYRGDLLENVGLNGYGLMDWVKFRLIEE